MDPRTRQAFTLWTQAQPSVSAFVHALVGDRSDRDEVLQTTAIAVLESIGSYDPSRPFLPWALGIARREVANLRRDAMKARSRFAALSDAAVDALAAAVVEIHDRERSKLEHLTACIERLDRRAREICDLRYRAGLKPARIADMLGLHPNTVSKALERLRDELRACIEGRLRTEGLA